MEFLPHLSGRYSSADPKKEVTVISHTGQKYTMYDEDYYEDPNYYGGAPPPDGWAFQENDGSFTMIEDKHVTDLITRAFCGCRARNRCGDGTATYTIGKFEYKANTLKGQQTNLRTNKTRTLIPLAKHHSAPLPPSSPIPFNPSMMDTVRPHQHMPPTLAADSKWAYENDDNSFTPIEDDTINQLLTDTHTQMQLTTGAMAMVNYFVGSFEYQANLSEMVQINLETGTKRALRPPHQVIVPSSSRYREMSLTKPCLSNNIVEVIVGADMSPTAVLRGLKEYASKHSLDTDVIDQLEAEYMTDLADIAVARAYTDESWVYLHINQLLRSEKFVALRPLAPFVKALCYTLKNTTSNFTHSTFPKSVKRRIKLQPEMAVKQYPVGRLFTWTSFTSTSTLEPSSKFGNVLFDIEYNNHLNDCGLFLEPFSMCGGEYEVLLPPGCKFKVLQVTGGESPTVKLQVLSTEVLA
eukprot:TRINITY_DN105424_c0_g1_i1.p1 TRINITY_DN105424_c0_g1~~TRINITY_DN105424_c0_g1_i1.p1  ORF type:complete len:466 (+),score=31.85 TRINITY_DN105424_c0_g1_i1:54-1451(+)